MFQERIQKGHCGPYRARLNDPANTEIYAIRGMAWIGLGDADNAIDDLNKAIEIDSKNPAAYVSRSMAWALK